MRGNFKIKKDHYCLGFLLFLYIFSVFDVLQNIRGFIITSNEKEK